MGHADHLRRRHSHPAQQQLRPDRQRREHPALLHHHQDALEPQREPDRRHLLLAEHPDEIVITPPPAEAPGQVRHRDLEDRPRVVSEPARQIEAQLHVRPRRARLEQPDQLLELRQRLLAGLIRDLLADRRQPRARPLRPARQRDAEDRVRLREQDQLHQARRRLARDPARRQLLTDPAVADLVELVDGDQRRRLVGQVDARREHHAAQQLPVIDPDLELREPQRVQHLRHRRAHLRLRDQRARPRDVDVALIELAKPPLAGSVRAPHRLDLVALEEFRQLVLRHHPGQRHRQVVAQPLLRQRGLGQLRRAPVLRRRPDLLERVLQRVAPLEQAIQQLVALLAVLAEQRRQVLDRRRLERQKSVPPVHLAHHGHHVVTLRQLGRQEVAHATGWLRG